MHGTGTTYAAIHFIYFCSTIPVRQCQTTFFMVLNSTSSVYVVDPTAVHSYLLKMYGAFQAQDVTNPHCWAAEAIHQTSMGQKPIFKTSTKNMTTSQMFGFCEKEKRCSTTVNMPSCQYCIFKKIYTFSVLTRHLQYIFFIPFTQHLDSFWIWLGFTFVRNIEKDLCQLICQYLLFNKCEK